MSKIETEAVGFKNGHLYCPFEDLECDIVDTYRIFREMKQYYNRYCVVEHAPNRKGIQVRQEMPIGDACYKIAEGYIVAPWRIIPEGDFCDDCGEDADEVMPITDPWGKVHGHICEACNGLRAERQNENFHQG